MTETERKHDAECADAHIEELKWLRAENEKLHRALNRYKTDIDAMRCLFPDEAKGLVEGDEECWFGPFEGAITMEGEHYIVWPNISILAERGGMTE